MKRKCESSGERKKDKWKRKKEKGKGCRRKKRRERVNSRRGKEVREYKTK